MRQREVQQGFFSQHQVTIFTVHLTIGQQHRNLAIISDCMEHPTAFVYCAQKLIVQFIKHNFPLVKKINYVRWVVFFRDVWRWRGNLLYSWWSGWLESTRELLRKTNRSFSLFSDGASGHFKNNSNMLNLLNHKIDLDLDACWTFTATGHGKGAGDGIGAVLKSTARRVTRASNIFLSTPRDFYEFSK